MQNPFAKLIREGEPSKTNRIADTRYKTVGGRIFIVDVYDDGREANELTEITIDPLDMEAVRKEYKNYRRRKGIKNWAELDI